MQIDLNCDMGEGFGRYDIGQDAELMPLISSANVACGFHASDPSTMHRTVKLAKEYDVAIGAHPSFPDLVGFGRREMAASPAEIRDDVMYQVGALLAFCKAEGVPLRHVKPHGALYNLAARDHHVAMAIAAAVHSVDPALYLVGLCGSAMEAAAGEAELKFAGEAFADRQYRKDRRLVSRREHGAVLADPEVVAERVVRMVRDGEVTAVDGTGISIDPKTVCVHGDTPGAVALLRAIRRRLEGEKIGVKSFGG
ncbi:5-oxoprolinase subunit PxpA [Candidatus Deferrimicrobium sp.]|uniref:LamB/YcsF family protein n=1 Tax=Candidatus Deferrimicrobium sp. TaxID=3060586 RepID=UPI002ED4CA12